MHAKYRSMTKAELIEALCALESGNGPPLQPASTDHETGGPAREPHDHDLVRELRARQVDLEMQNRELRESQAALEQSRSHYADLYDFAPVGYLTFDVEGRVLGANLTALALFNAMKSPVGSLFWSAVPVTSKKAFIEHLNACASSQQPQTTTLSVRRLRQLPQVIELRTAPLRNSAGEITGFRTVCADVTAAMRSERLIRFLARVSEQLAASLDPGTTLTTVVRAAVPVLADVCVADLRTESGELQRLEVAFARAVSPEVEARLKSVGQGEDTPRATVMRTGEPLLVVDARGHRSPTVQAYQAPVRSVMYVPMSARGRTLGVLTLITAESGREYTPGDLDLAHDMARRAAMAIDNAQLYDEAQRAIFLRETILAAASHDLKNPLYAIGMTAEALIAYGTSTPEALPVQLTSIKRAASQMERLIEDLLDLSSIQGGRLAIAADPLHVDAIGNDFADTARTIIQRKGLQLNLDFQPIAGTLSVDRDRIIQVFANLMGNAVKFTPEGGSISIGSELRDGRVTFYVRDTGPGIALEAVKRVFDAYWKAGDNTARGHGLGLYIARGIVEAHGGTIGVSTGPGVGSTFHFSLPWVPGHVSGLHAPRGQGEAQRTSQLPHTSALNAHATYHRETKASLG